MTTRLKISDNLSPHMRLFARTVERLSGHGPSQLEIAKPAKFSVAPYLDPEQLERERDALFRSRPVIIGHADQIPKPGDHFTHDALGEPLLVVRGKDDIVRGFYNVCRHRGMRLVENENNARKPSFVCPYHNWTYDLDGSLKNVPLEEAFEGIDLTCRSLKPAQLSVKHGFIFVQLDGATIDVGDFLGGISSDLDAFNTKNHTVYRQVSSVRKTNWKLIVEAFQDGYHVTRLHKKTVGPFFADSQFGAELVGDHIRALVARNEFADAMQLPPEKWDDRLHASFAYYLFPNTVIVIHPDYISHLGLFPLSVDETQIVHTFLIPEPVADDAAREHWEKSFDLIENGVFQSEDYFACEQIQKGLSSGANETLLVGSYEEGIGMFHGILNRALS